MRLPGFQTWLNMLFLAAAVGFPAAAESSQPADVILVNARIYTVNPQQAWADAIAVQGDKILAVGEYHRSSKWWRGDHLSRQIHVSAHSHCLALSPCAASTARGVLTSQLFRPHVLRVKGGPGEAQRPFRGAV